MIYVAKIETDSGEIILFYKSKKEAIKKLLDAFKNSHAFVYKIKNKDDPLLEKNLVYAYKDGTTYAFYNGSNHFKQMTIFDYV